MALMQEKQHAQICKALATFQKSWTSTGRIMGRGDRAFRVKMHCEHWRCIQGHSFYKVRTEHIAA